MSGEKGGAVVRVGKPGAENLEGSSARPPKPSDLHRAESWPPGLYRGQFPGSVYLLAYLEIMQPACVSALYA